MRSNARVSHERARAVWLFFCQIWWLLALVYLVPETACNGKNGAISTASTLLLAADSVGYARRLSELVRHGPEAVGAAGWCGVEAQTGGANHHDSYYACQSVPAGGFAVATCLALATACRGLYAANTSAAA